MAIATAISERENRTGAPSRGGRRGLRSALRHSRHVRLLRRALPLCCVGMVGVYVVSVAGRSGVDTGLPSLNVGRLTSTDLKMSNPKYSGFGSDGSAYTFAAKSATQDLLNPGIVTLDQITGQLVQADKTKIDVTALSGVYETKASVLDLTGGIKVTSESGLNIALPTAKLQTKEGLLTSPDPVAVGFPAGTINAVGLTLRQKVKEVTFNSQVVAHLKSAEKTPDAANAVQPGGAVNMFGQSDAPLDVTAKRLDVNDAKKTATFGGGVRAVQGDSVMETPELTVGYGGDAPAGAAPNTAPSALSATGKVKDIIAHGPVVMTRGTTDRVTSDRAVFDAQNETGVLTGHVVMTSGTDRRATGDRVDIDQRNERVALSGAEVVVTQGKNELRGQRLTVDRKLGRTQLTSPSSGRVHATLIQEGKKKSGETAAPGVGESVPATPLAGQFKSDPSAPVKVQANQLDVDDTAKTAVFSGDVVAAQGDIVMRTPELVASYTGAAGLADVAATQPAGAKAPAAQISRIEAKQKVQVTTKDGQTVDGDWANVDIKSNTITLGGNVLLKKGQSVVRNDRLVVDMASGEIKLDTAAKSSAGQGKDGWQASDSGDGVVVKGGRPSATFYPQELQTSRTKKP